MDRTRRRQQSDLRQFVFLEPPPNGMLIESLGWKFDKERKSPSYDLCHESCRRTYILRGVGSIQMVGLRSADVGQGYLNQHQCCCCCPIQSILHGRETDGRTVNNGKNIRRWTGWIVVKKGHSLRSTTTTQCNKINWLMRPTATAIDKERVGDRESLLRSKAPVNQSLMSTDLKYYYYY